MCRSVPKERCGTCSKLAARKSSKSGGPRLFKRRFGRSLRGTSVACQNYAGRDQSAIFEDQPTPSNPQTTGTPTNFKAVAGAEVHVSAWARNAPPRKVGGGPGRGLTGELCQWGEWGRRCTVNSIPCPDAVQGAFVVRAEISFQVRFAGYSARCPRHRELRRQPSGTTPNPYSITK